MTGEELEPGVRMTGEEPGVRSQNDGGGARSQVSHIPAPGS